jgi:hypothetical protein
LAVPDITDKWTGNALADGDQRSIARERLLEAAIDDIFDLLADQQFLADGDRLAPQLVASAKQAAVRVMSDPTAEETTAFWAIYAELVLASERAAPPVPRSNSAGRDLAGPARRALARLSRWATPAARPAVAGSAVAIAAVLVVGSVLLGRAAAPTSSGEGEAVIAVGAHLPVTPISSIALPMVGVLAGDIDPNLAAVYIGDHEGRTFPAIAVADEGPGYGEVFEPSAMEPLLLLPNARPDPVASVPFVDRSADQSVSFAGDFLG